MKNHSQSHEVPFEADTFKVVPVEQLDGHVTRVPVQMLDDAKPIPASCGKVLHIVMSKNAFCAWRSN